jgi:hypothetical protein
MREPITLPFNKDSMTVRDLKLAAETLNQILIVFDDHKDDPKEFTLRVLQIRDRWSI